MKRILSRGLRLIIQLLPNRLLGLLEIYVQEQQGKGYVTTVEQEVDILVKLLSKNSEKRVYALDIGANSGNWTIALKGKVPSARIDLFEPNSLHWTRLKEVESEFPDVEIFHFGLSDFDGEADFYSDSEGSTMASLQKRDLTHINLDFHKIGKVKIKKLDSLYRSAVIRPNVLKIDVEGFEYKVLLGAKELLNNVELFQFEFGGTALDTRIFFKDFWNFLHADFAIYRLSPQGLIEIKKYSEQDEVFRFTNYFAQRRTK